MSSAASSQKQAEQAAPSRPARDTRLVALGVAQAREYRLNAESISIGSTPDNDIVVVHDSVSRHHARITRHGARFRLTDLGSTNGTFVDGRRIEGTIALKPDNEIRLGAARFAFMDAQPPPARPAPFGIPLGLGTIAGILVLLFLAGFYAADRYRGQWRDYLARFEAIVTPTHPEPVATSEAVESPAGVKSPVAVAAEPSAAASGEASGMEPAWLARLNYYRQLAGLSPVVEDPALTRGDVAHTQYLLRNLAGTIRTVGLGAEAHSEDPKLPGYSDEGAAAARQSDVNTWYVPRGAYRAARGEDPDEWARDPGTPQWSIDGWIAIAFHRLPMLDPNLKTAGFGQFCDPTGACAAALNVAAGRQSKRGLYDKPVLFPPDGSTVPFRSFGEEWPDPLTSCPGYIYPVGVAITLQNGNFVDARLQAFSLKKIDGDETPVEACGFDEASFRSPDAVQQQLVNSLLHSFGAVEIIPRHPLERGARYRVAMTVNDRAYEWTFSIAK